MFEPLAEVPVTGRTVVILSVKPPGTRAVAAPGTCVLLPVLAVTRTRRRCRSKLSFSTRPRVNFVVGDQR